MEQPWQNGEKEQNVHFHTEKKWVNVFHVWYQKQQQYMMCGQFIWTGKDFL